MKFFYLNWFNKLIREWEGDRKDSTYNSIFDTKYSLDEELFMHLYLFKPNVIYIEIL